MPVARVCWKADVKVGLRVPEFTGEGPVKGRESLGPAPHVRALCPEAEVAGGGSALSEEAWGGGGGSPRASD